MQYIDNMQCKAILMTQARIYLRASTPEQNEERALASLLAFAKEQNYEIDPLTDVYADAGISGIKPLSDRPALKTLLKNSRDGDILLIEQVDRLSRMEEADWQELKREIERLRVVVVVMGLPMTHTRAGTRFDRSLQAFMLDVAAEQAHADYVIRRGRLAQGRANSTKPNLGRTVDNEKQKKALALSKQGLSINAISKETGMHRSTIAKYLNTKSNQ